MKLHLPVFLRKAILTLMLAYGVPAVHAADLTLGAADSLCVDYSVSDSLQNLNNGTLQLSGGTLLELMNCGEGDGKTYTLLTGVSCLLNAEGNPITLDSTNNAASLYFDTTQPGSGLWADGTLQLNHGALQLVLHNETVKDAITITTRQENPSAYQYYAGVSFENIEYAVDYYAEGGAIYGDNRSTITLNDNGSVTFSGNTASASTTTSSDSSYASAYGGAIYGGEWGSTITLSNNGSVTFSGNTAESASSSYSYAYGGAIYGDNRSTITLNDNGSVTFSGNTASASTTTTTTSSDSSAYGGAIYGDYGSTITLSNNGSVVFEGNTASASSSTTISYARGGAIYGGFDSTITLRNNGSVSFSGNTATGNYAYGGAIYTEGVLNIRNNDSVEFYQNAEVRNGSYRLRSIVAGGSGDEISLSAAAGKSLTFRDSIYIDDGSTFKLNESYEGMVQQGDIIFTGATTENDLYIVKNNVAGTEEEIQNSRTTEVDTITNLYGGRLCVEDGAIYEGRGISVMADSGATVRVKDATLNQYNLTFNGGTTFELEGRISVSGDVQMMEGSTLRLKNATLSSSAIGSSINNGVTLEFIGHNAVSGNLTMQKGSSLLFVGREQKGLTVLSGTLTLGQSVSYALDSEASWEGVNHMLLAVPETISDDEKQVQIFWGSSAFTWVGEVLVWNYNEETAVLCYKEGAVLTSRQTDSADYCHYNAFTAKDLTSSVEGGAINGSISLKHNGSVLFESNTAWPTSSYACGGAIYVKKSSNSTLPNITLSNNGSVVFAGNTARASSSYACGGAIYGDAGSTITLSNNGSVTFSGNTASGRSDDSSGGAIYGYGSTITLSNNGSVTFSGNTAESASSSSSSYACGGAIYGVSSTITLSDNGSVTFSGNTAESASSSSSSYACGGAIYGGEVTLSNNGLVSFEGNTASYGGAIDGRDVTLSNNESVTFSGNSASSDGGAIYGGEVTLSNNGLVSFEGNTASYGGAIYGGASLSNNGHVTFEGNTAYRSGGAIYGGATLSNNESVTFYGNKTSGTSSTSRDGGAIYGGSYSTITLSNNGSVVFEGNTASGSSYAEGGAIYGSTIALSDNGSVTFSGNTASGSSLASGGAIYTYNNLSIRNNESVLFEKNAEVEDDYCCLRSIVAGGRGNVISLSAAAGKTIEFRDSIYIGESSFNLNADYTDTEGNILKQQGDILFTGAYTAKHLTEVKGCVGTWSETLNSRTSKVNTVTNLYGGRLLIEDDAVYQGQGILAHEDSLAVVCMRNATMNHAGYSMRFARGTGLTLQGRNSASGNLVMGDGSVMTFNIGALNMGDALLTLDGSFILEGTLQLQFGESLSQLAFGCYNLLTVKDEVKGWNENNLILDDKTINASSIAWNANTLCFNYSDPNAPVIPDDPEIPDTPVTPDEPEIPDTPVTPDEPEIPDTPVIPDEPEIPDTPVTPDEPEIPDTPVTPDEPEIPDTPVTPDDPEIPDTPVTPDEPEIPDTPVTPDKPEIPDTPVTPDEPEIPDTPVTPDEPEIPDTPVTPDEPEIPDTPVTPDGPVNPDKPEELKPFYPGDSALVSGEIDKNNVVILKDKGTITLEGTVNAGAITVNSDKNITFKSNKKKPGSLTGDGDLTKKGKGTLTLNDGNGTWTGDIYLEAGTIKVKGTTSLGKGDVYVKGGTLNLGSKAIANDIIQSKTAAIKSGKKFTGTYTLESGELQKGSTLNIAKTATLAGGTVNGALSGTGKTEVSGNVKLGDKGKITTNSLNVTAGGTLTTGSKGLSMNSKASVVTVEEDASLNLGGKLSAKSLTVNDGTFKTSASKPAAVSLKGDMTLKGESTVQLNGKLSAVNLNVTDSSLVLKNAKPQSVSLKGNATLNNATATINGKFSSVNMTLNNYSSLTLTAAKPQNLTVKQNLTIGSGSALTLNGKLSAGSLTIKKDGMLTMSGSKPVTLKVKGALTLNEGSSIILNYSFVQGKTYKVLTFGSYSGSKDYYSIFGVEADDCTITNTGKALTLTVNTKWKPQTQHKAVSADAAEPVVATKSQANPVADALVQANWGQLESSRAFVNAMANRSMAVQLGNGERAVWASAIGSSSRHDTASGHNGADTNVSGGAFGLETQVGRASLLGMALGNSWTRVSAHGFGTIEQDTTHLGIYGQTNWRSGVTADWSAAYGHSESESMGSEWNQKQLQLDGRVSYNHELNANTLLSPFAGVQYYASDSAAIGTTDTGSLQNLRAEIGVAASHRTGKLGIYGEIAVHQDMARNNPSVSMEGTRYTGMTPGRTGLNFTVGASYELTDKWSVNASYTGEFVENANAHSANVGASYKF